MTHRWYRFFSFALGLMVVAMSLTLAATQVSGQTKTLVNADANGVGLHGYDPVAYFTDGKAVKGDPQYHSTCSVPLFWPISGLTVTGSGPLHFWSGSQIMSTATV